MSGLLQDSDDDDDNDDDDDEDDEDCRGTYFKSLNFFLLNCSS